MDNTRLTAWIDYIFEHPVAEPKAKEWYWAEDAPEWDGPREEIPTLIAETFERSGELLARFPDDQQDQGFWFLVGVSEPRFMELLVEREIPLETRLRALRSFVPLFEQVMAKRCQSKLAYCSEYDGSPLTSACFMWWDNIRWQWGRSPGQDGARDPGYALFDEDPDRTSFDEEVVTTLGRILAMPHDACRESALHGIGHLDDLILANPPLCRRAAQIVDEWLTGTAGLQPELIDYAKQAKVFDVQ